MGSGAYHPRLHMNECNVKTDEYSSTATSKAASAAPAVSKTQRVAGEMMEWLGDDARFVRDSRDDVVIASADNARRVRFGLKTLIRSRPHTCMLRKRAAA